MKCKYILSTLCMFGTMSLHAEEKGLGNILQQVGTQKKVVSKPEYNKKNSSKQSRFIFKDEYRSNGLGVKDKSVADEKSKSYEYENKSRFKFQFNDGAGNNNFVAGQRSPDVGGPIGGGAIGGGSVGGTSMGGGQSGGSGGSGGGRR